MKTLNDLREQIDRMITTDASNGDRVLRYWSSNQETFVDVGKIIFYDTNTLDGKNPGLVMVQE